MGKVGKGMLSATSQISEDSVNSALVVNCLSNVTPALL